jgi:hypothetical protein
MSQYINTQYFVAIINITFTWLSTLLPPAIRKYTVKPFYKGSCIDIEFSVIWQNESCVVMVICSVAFLESLNNMVLMAYVNDNLTVRLKTGFLKDGHKSTSVLFIIYNITLLTSGGRSVGIVCSQTQATEFSFSLIYHLY